MLDAMTRALPFTVSAPASSGNLGPGFDVLGMALELRNSVQVRSGSGTVHVQGAGADTLPADGSNVVAQAFARAAGRDIGAAGISLHCTNAIPPARGLGSSTAAAACGLIAGWEHAGEEWDEERLARELSDVDGHPDNAGACAWGGIVLCHDRPADAERPGLDLVPLGPADWIAPVVVIPDRELATEAARAVLPDTYPRADVVRALSAASLLAGGLLGGHPELLEDALQCDVLHEPYRATLVPELAEVRSAAAATRAWGATLSGAGPSVLVWCDPRDADQAVGSLSIDFPEHTVMHLRIASDGARVGR